MQSEVLPLLRAVDEFALHMKLWGRQSDRQYLTSLLSGFPATQAPCPVVNHLRFTKSRLAYIESGFLGLLAQITAIWLTRPEVTDSIDIRQKIDPALPPDRGDRIARMIAEDALEGSFPTGIDPDLPVTTSPVALPARVLDGIATQHSSQSSRFCRKSSSWTKIH